MSGSDSDDDVGDAFNADTPPSMADQVLTKFWGYVQTLQGSTRGRPTSATADVKVNTVNRRKRDVISTLSSFGSEREITTVLSWPQAKKDYPTLNKLVLQSEELTQIKQNVQNTLKAVGKSHKKALTSLLLADLPLAAAVELSENNSSYIHKARAASFKPLESRLCTEHYTPHSSKVRVHELEKKGTIAWAIESGALGAKSGQVSDDQYFRFVSRDTWYHEHYQTRYS